MFIVMISPCNMNYFYQGIYKYLGRLISKYSIEQNLISAIYDKKINYNSPSKFILITSCIYNLTLVSYFDYS